MDILEFAAARLGQHVSAPGGEGGECVDLVELWGAHLGASHVPGNAADLLATASPTEWRRVANAPLNAPPTGAIVVWRESPRVGIGRYGHTAVCVAADSMWLLTLDQNWPVGDPVRMVIHSYTGVAGWLERLPK